MKVYFYKPHEVGLEKYLPGLMRLPGFDTTEIPANADIYCLPSIMHHFSKEVLLNLKYLPGNEERHVVWDLADDFRTFGVPWIAIRCACTKHILKEDPTTIPWPWPVEPLPANRVAEIIHANVGLRQLPREFEYDASFWGWDTPLDLTRRACASVIRTEGLKTSIVRFDDFFGYKTASDDDFDDRRRGFVASLWQSRLSLCPASIDGVARYRFYEQMSMGRGLPVHICDNCVLPWPSKIDWDLIQVKVPEAEVDRTGEVVREWLCGHRDEVILDRAEYAQAMFNKWLHRDKWDELFGIAVRERLEGKI